MKNHLIFLFIAFAVLPKTLTYSQESPPSLAIGLGELIGARGTINVDVLADLIADKQEELKKEAIKRLVRGQMENGSYTFYSFTNQSMVNLFENKSLNATKRKLMENITNLAMVYGFSEFYLRTSYDLMGNKNLRKVIDASPETMLSPDMKQYWLNRLVDKPDPKDNVRLTTDDIKTSLNSAKASYSQIVAQAYDSIIPRLKEFKLKLDDLFNTENDALVKPEKNFYSISNFRINRLKPSVYKESNIPLSEVLLDMMYDIMIRSAELEDRGFFKVTRGIHDEKYRELNKYLYLMNQENNGKLKEAGITKDQLDVLRPALQGLYSRVESELRLLLQNYQMVKDLMRKGMSIEELMKHYEKRMAEVKSIEVFNTNLKELIGEITANLPRLKLKIESNKLLVSGDSLVKEKTVLLNDKMLNEANEMIKLLKNLLTRDNNSFSDYDVAAFKNKAFSIKTKLIAMELISAGKDTVYDKIYAYIWYQRIKKLNDIISKSSFSHLAKVNLTTLADFMELLSNMGSLHKADTYDEVLRLVLNAGHMYDDFYNTTFFNQLVGNIEKYASLDTKNDRIDLDVEAIILALYDKWSKKTELGISFYFTIGIGQSFAGKSDTSIVNPNSFGFASEKIGIRWKIINWEKMRANQGKNRGWRFCSSKPPAKEKPGKPYIKNWNLTAYGSGLMYNIINSTTRENFAAPMFAVSTGLQFFNGLEFNLFAATPLYSKYTLHQNATKNQFFGISFDVPITDYINAVRKKRQDDNQRKKQQSVSNPDPSMHEKAGG